MRPPHHAPPRILHATSAYPPSPLQGDDGKKAAPAVMQPAGAAIV